MSLLFNTWKLLLENMGYLFSFFSGHLSTHCFKYLDTCPFFLYFSFCIAIYLFLQLENFKKDIYKNLEHLFLTNIFVSSPSVGVKHFWWMENMWLCTPSVEIVENMWSVCDLDLESMINFSTRVTRFDQTQYKHKLYM
jgi:hypothetical protein